MTTPDDARSPLAPPLAAPLTAPIDAATAPAPAAHGWWRRNALALGTIAVLLPVTTGIIGWHEWWGYFSGRAVIAIDPAANGTVTHADTVWGPVKSAIATKLDGLDIPPDTQLVIVEVPVDPQGDAGAKCMEPQLVEQSTGRRWPQTRAEIGLGSSFEEPTNCSADLIDPYSIFVPFVVPADASGPYWVEIETFTNPEFVRFTVDPKPAP